MIVIPMAGLSSRFFKSGYKVPKYMLEAHGKTLFEHSVNSFEKYFKTEKFIFIVRDVYQTVEFVEHQVKKLGIINFEIVRLDTETKGQAETVYLGLENIHDPCSVTIFNIDTFRPKFEFPDLNTKGSGYLEVFIGDGNNWSYVMPKNNESTIVIKTAEKKRISELCCTGLYHFSNKSDFIEAYNNYISLPKEHWECGELYIAPLYNYLIENGKEIHFDLIERKDVIFCGVPQEYDDFKFNQFV
ncbi:glycosyltransferase family 2 protein [Vibrio fluvialis]|nr:glycosyltransferase family 2 protein [Vibrio fluvialis]